MEPIAGLFAIFILIGIIYIVINAQKNSDSWDNENDNFPKYSKNFGNEGSLKNSLSRNLDVLSKTKAADKKRDKIQKAAVQKRYKILAKFYNSYKFIDYAKKSNKKIASKQMSDIIKVVIKNLQELSDITNGTKFRMLVVGMMTFKHVKKETVIAVHKDLGKLLEVGKELDFDDRLLSAIEDILDNDAGMDY